MPKVVAEYRAQARARILDAASTVFRREGFRAATMDDIAREIGVSKGALYLYFRTKSALLAELQKRSRATVLQAWQELPEEGDLAAGIASSLDEVFSGTVDPGVWLELIGESATDPELRLTLRRVEREDLRTMKEFLHHLEERGRIRRVPERDTVAEIILALLRGTLLDVLVHGRGEESRHTLVRALRYLLPQKR
ncbi:MAG: TetR/AcrR family transcriptional regulator [Thermoplasmata archaeon]